ncbi:MAG TPA: DNA replication and repair protein RecF [Bacteroidales bacterium]|nr:DNA replication and repair protein RecF [Bacteroidales bacterium]HPS71381.1 DNA replication and repair protein RecF [Bacteroidales bacterium]
MVLKNLFLTHFKNYNSAEFSFHENVNCILGNNGSGKTNLLDAIHYLSFCKSYFTAQDNFSLQFNEDFFAIHGDFYADFNENSSNRISCIYKNGRKSMKNNQKEYDRLSDHIGLYPLIMVSPYDNDIINEGSELRRKFFDIIISQSDREYLSQLISYQKILNNKNIVLKQILNREHQNTELLQIYNDQIAPFAIYIFEKRNSFIGSILDDFKKYYNYLAQNSESVDIVYESQLQNTIFQEGLKSSEIQDLKSGFSNFGIHKDDFKFIINENPLKRFGSQGQQKSFALALKLAQYDYIYKCKNSKPLLLLDDIFDKLDGRRINQLLELVGKHHFGQVFITDTDEARIKEILFQHDIEHKIIRIE